VKGSSDAARTRIIYVSIGLIFALLVASYLVYQIAVAVLVLLLTMLFSVIISAPVDYLEHRGMSRGLGTLVVFGGLVLGIWIAGIALAPTIADQAVQLWETFPELLENAQDHAGQLASGPRSGSAR
jgi:predicted PurR-regulated permease PerM